MTLVLTLHLIIILMVIIIMIIIVIVTVGPVSITSGSISGSVSFPITAVIPIAFSAVIIVVGIIFICIIGIKIVAKGRRIMVESCIQLSSFLLNKSE